jgi:hypothetical protein
MLEISDQAYSQRLRRGLATLVAETLLADETASPRPAPNE